MSNHVPPSVLDQIHDAAPETGEVVLLDFRYGDEDDNVAVFVDEGTDRPRLQERLIGLIDAYDRAHGTRTTCCVWPKGWRWCVAPDPARLREVRSGPPSVPPIPLIPWNPVQIPAEWRFVTYYYRRPVDELCTYLNGYYVPATGHLVAEHAYRPDDPYGPGIYGAGDLLDGMLYLASWTPAEETGRDRALIAQARAQGFARAVMGGRKGWCAKNKALAGGLRQRWRRQARWWRMYEVEITETDIRGGEPLSDEWWTAHDAMARAWKRLDPAIREIIVSGYSSADLPHPSRGYVRLIRGDWIYGGKPPLRLTAWLGDWDVRDWRTRAQPIRATIRMWRGTRTQLPDQHIIDYRVRSDGSRRRRSGPD